MFVRFGLLAAVRNLHRSALAVTSIALATVIIVSALLLAQGQPGHAHLAMRAAAGADIIVTVETLCLPGTTTPPEGRWEMMRRSPDSPGMLAYFFPEIVEQGIPGMGTAELSVETIEASGGVAGVLPYRTIPALMHTDQGVFSVQIRGRDPSVDDSYRLSEAITRGRYLSPADSGEMTAVMEAHRITRHGPSDSLYGYDRWNGIHAVIDRGAPAVRRYTAPDPGEILRLSLPAGEDILATVPASLEVVGHVEFRTGSVSWVTYTLTPAGLAPAERFDEDHPGLYSTEPLYWSLPEIWVSEETFEVLLERTGGGSWAQPTEYLVTVDDLSQVNRIADQMRAALPGGTVLTFDELVSLSDLLPEPAVSVPPGDILVGYATPFAAGRAMISSPDWFEVVLVLVAVALAGLLYLGNLYVLTITRRDELAALKALGSYNWQLLVAMMTEVAIISGLGTLIGYLVSTPMLIHLWVTNALGVGVILWRLIRGLAMVMALVLGVSFVIALVPYARTARLSPGEVLRDA